MFYVIFGLIILALKLPIGQIAIIYLLALLVSPSGQRRFLLYGLIIAVFIVDLQGAFLHYNDQALPETVSGYVYRIADGKADIYIEGQKYRLRAKGLSTDFEGQCIALENVVLQAQKTLNRATYNYQSHYQLLGYRGYLKGQLVGSVAAPPDQLIRRLSHHLRAALFSFSSALGRPAQVLTKALLLGEIDDANLLHRVKELGLLHLFVISGYHFAVIAALAMVVLHRLLRMPYRLSLATVIVMSLFYLTVVKLGFGSLRASFAVLLSAFYFLTKRKNDAVQIALLYVFIVLSINLAALFDLGFQLTVLTYIAVVLTSRQLKRWHIETPTLQGLVISAVVFVTIGSILIYSQGKMPLASVLLVPLLTPLVGAFIVIACAGLLLSGFGLAHFLSWPINFLAERIYDFINWSHQLAHLTVHISPFLALAFVVLLIAVGTAYILTNRNWRLSSGLALGLFIAGILLFQQVNFGLTINSYALYDGEAYLIRAPQAVVMYDVGNSPEIINILRRAGVAKIDAIIISHAHRDHDGMLADICQQFEVDKIIRQIDDAQQLEIGALKLNLYRAPLGISDNLNDQSIACHLRYGEFDMLFNGDMEEASTVWLVEQIGQLPVEVLKVPHHGSYNENFGDLLVACQPQVAVIGGGNGKRIDKTKTLQVLRTGATPYYDTMPMGEIAIKVSARYFTIEAIASNKIMKGIVH